MYNDLKDSDDEYKKAKITKMGVIKKLIFKDYKKCLKVSQFEKIRKERNFKWW